MRFLIEVITYEDADDLTDMTIIEHLAKLNPRFNLDTITVSSLPGNDTVMQHHIDNTTRFSYADNRNRRPPAT
jgi:hypothetical protein